MAVATMAAPNTVGRAGGAITPDMADVLFLRFIMRALTNI